MKYYDLKTVRPEVLTLLQKAAKGSSCQHELNNLLIDGVIIYWADKHRC